MLWPFWGLYASGAAAGVAGVAGVAACPGPGAAFFAVAADSECVACSTFGGGAFGGVFGASVRASGTAFGWPLSFGRAAACASAFASTISGCEAEYYSDKCNWFPFAMNCGSRLRIYIYLYNIYLFESV